MHEFPSWRELARERLSTTPFAFLIRPSLEWQFDPVNDDDLIDRLENEWPIAYGPHHKRVDSKKKNGPIAYHPDLLESIGTTWRDVDAGETVALYLDFDNGHGHNAHDDAGIARIDELATKHHAILNVASKGGKGRAWVVPLTTPLPAKNRAEHARNCKAARDTLSAILGVDLSKLTDATPGANHHVWHREPKEGGYRLLHPCTGTLDVDLPPPKPEPERREHDKQDWDETHQSIFDTMRAEGWVVNTTKTRAGKPMAEIHACGLLADHKKHRRAGRYSTASPGTDKSKPNALAFPQRDGKLTIIRLGTEEETEDWTVFADSQKTGIFYNMPIPYNEAVKETGKFDRRGHGVIRDFPEFTRLLGIDVFIPELLLGREISVRRDNTSLYITIPGEKEEAVEGWHYSRKTWEFDLECFPDESISFQDRIRQTTDKYSGKSLVIQVAPENWKAYPLSSVKTYLEGYGLTKIQIATAIKDAMEHSYELVQIPFAGEYPGPGLWNRFGARLACEPVKGEYPAIRMILDHCGANLTPMVKADSWCKEHGVETGGDYLMVWGARMFRYPDMRLPGLNLYSVVQNTGKSSLGRAFACGFKDDVGWCKLRKEITRDDFNDQMRGAALCLIEETDLSTNPAAYQLIKDLIDNPYIKLRGIYSSAETEVNFTHIIHTCNDRRFSSVYPGDTRFVMIRVDPFEGTEMDWAETLRPLVKGQMPAFLYDVMNMKFPKGCGRLYLPVLETEDKKLAMEEKAAEVKDWYSQLLADARNGWIVDLTANEVLRQLAAGTIDKKLPKTASAMATILSRMENQFARDGFTLTVTPGDKKTPAKYTIGLAV